MIDTQNSPQMLTKQTLRLPTAQMPSAQKACLSTAQMPTEQKV
jgi:hypothetical protein